MRRRTNWPGISRPSGFSNTARTRTVPVRGVDLVVDQLQAALDRLALLAGGRDLHRNLLDLCRSRPSRSKRAQRPRHHLLVGVEAGVNRIDRDQRGQHRRAGACCNQIADRDLKTPDAACNRRTHLGVVQVQLGGLQRSLGCASDWRPPRDRHWCAGRSHAATRRASPSSGWPRSTSPFV